MFIITFDEHGGFYDHQPPPIAVPPGDKGPYVNPNYTFRFDRLGIRVPAILVSAYTSKGTVIGKDPSDPSTIFDHTSVLATVEKLFELRPLTARDEKRIHLKLRSIFRSRVRIHLMRRRSFLSQPPIQQ